MKPTALGTELAVNRGRMKPRAAHDDGLAVILQRRSETDGLLLGTAGGALFRGAAVLLPLPPARRCVERLLLGTAGGADAAGIGFVSFVSFVRLAPRLPPAALR